MSKTNNTLQIINNQKINNRERSLSINELKKIYVNKMNNSNNFYINEKNNFRNSKSISKLRENRNFSTFTSSTTDSSSGLAGLCGSLGMQGKIQGQGICCCSNNDSDKSDDYKVPNCHSIEQQVNEITNLSDNIKEVEEHIRRLKYIKEGKLSKIDDLRVLIERIASEQSFVLQNSSFNRKPFNSSSSYTKCIKYSSNVNSKENLHHNNMPKEIKLSKAISNDNNDSHSSSTEVTTEEGETATEGAEQPFRCIHCCCNYCRNENGQNYEENYYNEVPVEFFNVSNQLCRYWQENVIRQKVSTNFN